MDINDGILRDLDPESGSSKLKELVYDFDDVLRDSQRPKGLGVYSFQEELGMTGVSLLGGKVSLPWKISERYPTSTRCQPTPLAMEQQTYGIQDLIRRQFVSICADVFFLGGP